APDTPEAPGVPEVAASAASAAAAPAVVSEARPQPEAEPLPRGPAAGPHPHPHPHPGVSLTRSRAVTERMPAPGGPIRQAEGPPAEGAPAAGEPPARGPGGELPGPAVAAASVGGGRRARTRPGRAGRRSGPRRGALAALAAVVVAGVVAAVLLATAPGGHDGDGRTAGSPPGPSAIADSAVTTAAPSASPTVEGTFRPPSLPPGAHQEAGGFAWATPRGWRRDVKTGAEVHYTSPDGVQELVAKSSLARGDLMDTWRTSEQNAREGRDYRKIRLEETTFRGLRAVVWEYTFTLRGTPWHARLLGFDENGTSYQVNTWYQPGAEASALPTYEKVKDSFTVT
ncbi:serine/threonine protein kinase, partial [Streptomyces sp. IBSBF 2807]|nr:serine/threonine protein kinase [Streptomyces hilarionis]